MVKDKMMMRAEYRENPLWGVIRENSRFCAMCGGKLDLPFKDFHLPFCTKCRDKTISKIMRENYGKKKG